MRQVFRNRYLKIFQFATEGEVSTFLSNQPANTHISLSDSFGENYYCIICYQSLTSEKLFSISFESELKLSQLLVFDWEEQEKFLISEGRAIYIFNSDFNSHKVVELTTPLVGIYLIESNRLLILEEAYLRIVNGHGDILQSEKFDLIEDFSINDNLLRVRSGGRNLVFELIPQSSV